MRPQLSSGTWFGCGTTALPAVAGASGKKKLPRRRPTSPPASWAAMKNRADVGAMPAKVSEKIRPTVTAGFAKDVELVNQYAAPIYAPTAAAENGGRPVR